MGRSLDKIVIIMLFFCCCLPHVDIPPTPSPAVNVTRSQGASASIFLTFDAVKDVDMYSIGVSGDQGVNCPLTCNPSSDCVCTGLEPGEDVMVTLSVSAVNCVTRFGLAYEVSFTPRG